MDFDDAPILCLVCKIWKQAFTPDLRKILSDKAIFIDEHHPNLLVERNTISFEIEKQLSRWSGIRFKRPMTKGGIYYWKFKIDAQPSCYSVMFGVVTADTPLAFSNNSGYFWYAHVHDPGGFNYGTVGKSVPLGALKRGSFVGETFGFTYCADAQTLELEHCGKKIGIFAIHLPPPMAPCVVFHQKGTRVTIAEYRKISNYKV